MQINSILSILTLLMDSVLIISAWSYISDLCFTSKSVMLFQFSKHLLETRSNDRRILINTLSEFLTPLRKFDTTRRFDSSMKWVSRCDLDLTTKISSFISSLSGSSPEELVLYSIETVMETISPESVEVKLENKDLWDKFNTLGTEMVITKTGRWVELYWKYIQLRDEFRARFLASQLNEIHLSIPLRSLDQKLW